MRLYEWGSIPHTRTSGPAIMQLGSDLVCDGLDRDTEEASRHLVFAWFPISRGLILDLYLLSCYFWGVLKSNLNEGETMGHSIMCSYDAMAEAFERQRREEEKKKQTMTVEVVTTNEVDLPPISRVGKSLICDNLPKGDRDVI